MFELWSLINAVAEHSPDEDSALFLKTFDAAGGSSSAGSEDKCVLQQLLDAHARLFQKTFNFDRGYDRRSSWTTYMHMYHCHLVDQLKAMRVDSLLFANQQGLEANQKPLKRGIHEVFGTGAASSHKGGPFYELLLKHKKQKFTKEALPLTPLEANSRYVSYPRAL